MSSAVESDELEGDNPEFSAFASKYVQVEVEARAVAAVVVQARHSMLGSNDSLVESSEGSLAAPEGDEKRVTRLGSRGKWKKIPVVNLKGVLL